MAATPPPHSPVCPPTPMWPAKYEHPREVRRSSRIAAGKPSLTAEPSTPTFSDRSTPPPTVKKDKAARNLFGTSGTNMNDGFASNSTSMQTPKKKKTDAPQTPASLHRSAKTASRLQKFSLDQRNDNPITIFEDSKDRIPGPIKETEDDIFKPSDRAKRRKVNAPAAARNEPDPSEDGMMVIQRGRRTYKKFEDAGMFTDPMPRKKLFTELIPAAPAVQAQAPAPVDTDDEETEREESPEPPVRNVRFIDVTTSAVTSSVSEVMKTPAKATKSKAAFRTPKSAVEISNTSFLTPPATIQREEVNSSFEDGESHGRSSVKRKLSYTGPATPEATPAKKRSKLGASSGTGTPRDEDVFSSSPARGRRAPGKTRG
ncbi:hypothetical protein ABW19_dt0207704 [Dactylella cylindrospora]|nr:hypothetical protein ABW19_dt0207704 [Dactylella cylindrospora]